MRVVVDVVGIGWCTKWMFKVAGYGNVHMGWACLIDIKNDHWIGRREPLLHNKNTAEKNGCLQEL